MRRRQPWPTREDRRRPTVRLHGGRGSAIRPHDRCEQDRHENCSESEARRAKARRFVAVFHEVKEHHGQNDHEDDQKYWAEHRVSKTALKQRSEPDHLRER